MNLKLPSLINSGDVRIEDNRIAKLQLSVESRKAVN